MKPPKELTTVTSLSKILAIILFISLPFIGFFLGIRYQEMVDLAKRQEMEANLSIPRTPTPTTSLNREQTGSAISPAPNGVGANWKTYIGTGEFKDGWQFSIQYPPDWEIIDNKLYPYGKPPSSNNSIFSGTPVIVLGSGGFDYGSVSERKFPAGTADYTWGGDSNIVNGLANFRIGNNSYTMILAKNIPGKDNAAMEQIFNQIVSTLKFTQ